MTRLAVTFTLAAMFTASTPIVLDAQRGMAGGRAGGVGGVPAGGDGRGGGGGVQIQVQGGGVQIQVQGGVNLPARPLQPMTTITPSINRPFFPIDGLNRPSFPLSGPPGVGLEVASPFAARAGTFTRLHGAGSFGIPIGYGGAVYGPSYAPESTYDRYRRTPEPEITTGTLFLEVTPVTTLVFVDTAYVGTVGDLQARGLTLSAGRHFLDLEAPDYDKKTIEIVITAGEPLRYRVDLTRTQRAAAVVIPLRPPETMYAIPGCYGGNRPPVAANLPKGCDIAKVRVLRPQPRTN